MFDTPRTLSLLILIMDLWTTPEFDALTYIEMSEIVNGCGPADCRYCRKYLDNALGIDVFMACALHDYMYFIGGGKKDRRHADIVFIVNLLVIALNDDSAVNFVRVPYLFFYYFAVRLQGKRHFNWTA